MPDITMCRGAQLAVCRDCYRRTAQPDAYRQSWMEPPNQGKHCDCYVPPQTKTEKKP